eukprot:gene6095-biopygen20818
MLKIQLDSGIITFHTAAPGSNTRRLFPAESAKVTRRGVLARSAGAGELLSELCVLAGAPGCAGSRVRAAPELSEEHLPGGGERARLQGRHVCGGEVTNTVNWSPCGWVRAAGGCTQSRPPPPPVSRKFDQSRALRRSRRSPIQLCAVQKVERQKKEQQQPPSGRNGSGRVPDAPHMIAFEGTVRAGRALSRSSLSALRPAGADGIVRRRRLLLVGRAAVPRGAQPRGLRHVPAAAARLRRHAGGVRGVQRRYLRHTAMPGKDPSPPALK